MTDQAAKNTIAILTAERDRIRAEYDAYFDAARKREAHLQSCISYEIDKRQAQVRELTILHQAEREKAWKERDAAVRAREGAEGLLREARDYAPSAGMCREADGTVHPRNLQQRIDAHLANAKKETP